MSNQLLFQKRKTENQSEPLSWGGDPQDKSKIWCLPVYSCTHPVFIHRCHSSFSSLSLSPLQLSLTHALQRREKDLGDHLKPIMAALQPPRNSVTDGDLVFIAGVIGSACAHSHAHARTHTPTHTHKEMQKKKISTFRFQRTRISHSLCLH